jgi:hypothetical protein
MKTKTDWWYTALLAGVLVATGCGSGSGASGPPPPNLGMSGSSVDFGDVAVGTIRTQGLTLSNTGGSSLSLQQNSVSGAGFTSSGIGGGVTLDPGQYVTLALSFDPTATGKSNGTVSLTSSTSSSPVNFPLSGNGVDPAKHSVVLNWNASTSVVVGYDVYRNAASGGSWTKLNSSPVTTTSYTDWDVQAGGSYLYAVASVNSANFEGISSEAVGTLVPTP